MTFNQAPDVQLPGTIFQRPGSSYWWYAVSVPSDLARLPQYSQSNGKPVKWAYRASLRTRDRNEAERLAMDVLRGLQDQWAIVRRQSNPVPVQDLTPQMVAQMGDYIRFCVFHADDYFRNSPEESRKLAAMRDLVAGKLRRVQVEEALQEPVGAYLDDYAAEGLENRNQVRDAEAGKAVARRNPEAILQDAQGAAKWLGVSYDWTKPEARSHLLKLTDIKRQALEDLTQRDKGKVVPTPDEPKPVASAPVKDEAVPCPSSVVMPSKRKAGEPVDILRAAPAEVSLRDVLNDWAAHGKAGRKPYPPKTVGKYRKAVERFETLTNNPSMAQVDRVCGAQFKRTMKALEGAQAMADATVRDTLINCGTLLGYYSRQTGKIPGRLWEKLTDKPEEVPQQSSRDEWTEEELQRLFGLPVWQHYALPTSKNGGLDAAYWVPLLGLFTGARVTELAQLRVDDFTEQDGVWFLRMAVTAEGQSLKKRDSWRTIPLAQGLIDLGLIEYRQHIIELRQDWLFPGVTKDAQNNAGGGVSKWFSTLKIKHGFRSEVVFHSFRGSLITRLMRQGVGIEHRCKYVGQKPEGGVNVTNYNKLKPEDLCAIAKTIDFPFLALPKVYKTPMWSPVVEAGGSARR